MRWSQLSTSNSALRFGALLSCVRLHSYFMMRCGLSIPCGLIERGIRRHVEWPSWSTGDVILTTLLRCESKSSETSDDELDHLGRKGGQSCGLCGPQALGPVRGIAFPLG